MADADVADATANLKKLNETIRNIKSADKDRAKRLNEEATSIIRSIDKALRAVEADAKNAPPSQRRQKQEVLAQLRQELASRRSELQKINDAASRDTLLSRTAQTQAKEQEVGEKAASAASKAQSSTTKLLAAQQVLQETTDIGVNVVDTMTQQRESLLRTQGKAGNVNTLTDQARSIMRMMQARAVTNKALLAFAILVLMAAVGAIVWYGYIYQPKGSNNSGDKK